MLQQQLLKVINLGGRLMPFANLYGGEDEEVFLVDVVVHTIEKTLCNEEHNHNNYYAQRSTLLYNL